MRKKLTSTPNTGFGANSQTSGSRFYRKDGSINVIRRGVPFFDRLSWFHTMVTMPRWKFWLSLVGIYLFVNLVFATIYYAIGIEQLGGVDTGSPLKNFTEAFFFSAQTVTTVGYGHISPEGFLTSAIASFEAFIGVLSFALASGLFYGRFSMPKPHLYFSNIALIAPYKDGKALMFRTVPYKNNNLTEAEVKLMLAMRIRENGVERNMFYPLEVEFSKVNSLVLNWTIVHPINEDSPLYEMSLAELKATKAELIVFLKAYDEVFANSVVARTSFTANEIIENAKFKPMYHPDETGDATVLNVDRINDYEKIEIPVAKKQTVSG